MRADELAALSQAVSVLSTTVAEKATATGSGGRTEPVEALAAKKVVVQKAAVRAAARGFPPDPPLSGALRHLVGHELLSSSDESR